MYHYLHPEAIRAFIQAALREDVGSGDHSSLSSIPAGAQKKARLIVKDQGILAGIEMAGYIFKEVDPSLQLTIFMQDSSPATHGQEAFHVSGNARNILTAERLVLNCMQRMSGIATLTHEITQKIKHTKARLLDTRKTTPNFRLAEKWAVKIGGGENHRYGLFDMIMLKDNHIDYAGGITQAIAGAQQYLKEKNLSLPIEVETRSLEEVNEVLSVGGIYRIMLDNMSPALMREAVKLIAGRYPTEASGGITKDNIVEVAETGVDYISVGALTHSIKSMDMSLKAF